jgi:hypothetical protein
MATNQDGGSVFNSKHYSTREHSTGSRRELPRRGVARGLPFFVKWSLMLRPGEDVDVYLYAYAVDMRKSINGLSIIVEQSMVLPTNSGALFVFCNRGRDKIKILCWERNGFIVWYKRLERQRFSWPKIQDTLSLSGRELNWLLDGFDLFSNQPHEALHFDSVS